MKFACHMLLWFVVSMWPHGLGATESGPVHWRVVWTSDPTTEATISWDTRAAGRLHRVHVRAGDNGEGVAITCHRNERYKGPATDSPWHVHHARLTNLKPASRYHVTLESDGVRSDEFYFETAADDGRPFALLFGGDSRSGLKQRAKMNRFISRLCREQLAAGRPPVVALAHGGDYIYDGRRLDQWLRWLADHQLTTGDDRRLLPIIPARGNHDVGALFNQVFDFPAGDRNYYAVEFGRLLWLGTLNTETSTAGDQQAWLAERLAEARPTFRWLVAQYHRPAFPAVKIPSGAYASWVPLFEKHNVDLVCEADGHCIKRTPAVRNNAIDPTGVVYVGEGGLGVGQRSPKSGRWYLDPAHAKVGRGHHVHLLTIRDDQLSVRVILDTGEVFDEHVLQPREL